MTNIIFALGIIIGLLINPIKNKTINYINSPKKLFDNKTMFIDPLEDNE